MSSLEAQYLAERIIHGSKCKGNSFVKVGSDWEKTKHVFEEELRSDIYKVQGDKLYRNSRIIKDICVEIDDINDSIAGIKRDISEIYDILREIQKKVI